MRNNSQNRFGMKAAWSLLLAASMLSGCTVGPNYHRPVVQTPAAFHGPDESQQAEAQAASFADLPWWQVFHDPQLQELIRTALKQNYDLQLAVERVSAARAQVGIVRSNQFPQVSLNPEFSGGKTDQNIKSNVFTLAGDVVFQVDLFGRYRRATEAARAQLLGTQDAQQTVILTLVSDVATDYFLLRDLDLQLQITKETVRTQEDSVKLTELRLQHGVGTTLDVLQARQVLDTANAQIPDLERQIGQTEDAINILWGIIRKAYLAERRLESTLRMVGRGAKLCRRSCPPACPLSCSSADQISVKRSRTWLQRTQISAWPRRCSFRKSPCSALEADHGDTANLPERIFRRLAE
jgi:multidrug efflux system outer membrane protein